MSTLVYNWLCCWGPRSAPAAGLACCTAAAAVEAVLPAQRSLRHAGSWVCMHYTSGLGCALCTCDPRHLQPSLPQAPAQTIAITIVVSQRCVLMNRAAPWLLQALKNAPVPLGSCIGVCEGCDTGMQNMSLIHVLLCQMHAISFSSLRTVKALQVNAAVIACSYMLFISCTCSMRAAAPACRGCDLQRQTSTALSTIWRGLRLAAT